MSETMTFSEFLSKLPQTDATVVLGSSSNSPVKMTQRSLASLAFGTVSNTEDLDNPTTRGVFSVNETTRITRPTVGTGWKYGNVLNFAMTTGIQVWFNFDGYIAIRGKGSVGGNWSDWAVMAKWGVKRLLSIICKLRQKRGARHE